MRRVAAVCVLICMCSYSALTTAASALTKPADSIRWLDNIEAGRAEAQRTGKLLLVHFWSTHCGPCVQLERSVYSRVEVVEAISRHFVAVKINTETHPELARRHSIRFVPTDVVIDPSGRLLATQKCPPHAPRYLAGLLRLVPISEPSASDSSIPQTPIAQSVPSNNPNPGHAPLVVGPRYANLMANATTQVSPPTMTPRAAAPSNPPAVKQPIAPWDIATTSASNTQTGMSGTPHASPGNLVSQSAYLPTQVALPPARSAAANLPTAPRTVPLPPAIDEPSLDGMCPVELVEKKKWVAGDTQWGAYHRGRLYLFSGERQQQRFLANPDYYSPVLSGYDPVVAAEKQAFVLGHRKHGVFYENRVYLFANEGNLERFYQSPNRFRAVSVRP